MCHTCHIVFLYNETLSCDSTSRPTLKKMSISRRIVKLSQLHRFQRRFLATTPDIDAETKAMLNAERFVEEVDVVVVGAGPSGLSAAIKIRQLAQQQNKEVRVLVVEKGGEVGMLL